MAEEKTSFDISTSIYQAHIASFPLTPCHICYIALYTKMKHANSIKMMCSLRISYYFRIRI